MKGLYQKYYIKKASGKPLDPNFEAIVLRIDGGRYLNACRFGAIAFAEAVREHNSLLANDIQKRLQVLKEGERDGRSDGKDDIGAMYGFTDLAYTDNRILEEEVKRKGEEIKQLKGVINNKVEIAILEADRDHAEIKRLMEVNIKTVKSLGLCAEKIEQLRKALDEIDKEADDTYENSEVPELNDCIDRMQQIAKQELKVK
ncbi:hypothetical protein LCGC14_0828900 [marine sediment metagenome]|uniref:Uncharacterized protein n=1 Tax=marine sediment metagenome TaxID=412755 RepID=A0A0F9PL89_9ZZZZ